MDFLQLLLAGVALVWVAVVCLRVPTLVAFCVTVLAAAVFGVEFWHLDSAGLPITIDRAILGGTLVAFIVQRRLGRADPKPFVLADKILFAFLALLTISYCAGTFKDAREQGITQFRLMV